MRLMRLMKGDCIEAMKHLEDGSVDLILTDLPYGTTLCKWDEVINFEALWEQYHRVIKDNGAIVLFSKQPFTSKLISSNYKNFKYTLVWEKDNHDNPLMAKKRFLNITEDICIFYKKQCNYYPQGLVEVNKITKQGRGESLSQKNTRNSSYVQQFTNYPKNILKFKRDLPNIFPTQKPVALLEYLIKTFTQEGEVVLDSTMGSGSTGVACINTKRSFIGIEINDEHFDQAKKRIDNHLTNKK